MNDRIDIVDHLINHNCKIISDRSEKHSVFVNTLDISLKSALLKQDQLSDKYVINVCKCLCIPVPVMVDIRNPNF
ncbi:hypothetical protein BC749_102244 [Flavobacterium araucananum]|nr:hypothetical protein BC749_102244 [Flavobacterium araucananum]